MIGAIGVVYGDIGTSPLYALQGGASAREHGMRARRRRTCYGLLSLVFWALIVVVTLKYVVLIMRADNNGEGGILALLALASRGTARERPARAGGWSALGIFGAAMFYGDGMITPAISVLSARRGARGRRRRRCTAFVVPVTLRDPDRGCSRIQRRGTARGGRASSGRSRWSGSWRSRCSGVAQHRAQPGRAGGAQPAPRAALRRATTRAPRFLALGAVVLARHRRRGALRRHGPLRHSGRSASPGSRFVMPALLLNYFGQGALLLARPGGGQEPVLPAGAAVGAAPAGRRSPTCATVIASQAVISGAFSLTRQAIQLGYLPAPRHPAHLRARDRPDLRALHQLDAVRRGRPAGASASGSSEQRWPAPTASR
ncbi:MAG: KUP/HAK/KT family potassium transporter [Comamonadaceae bacterium]|nr:KUP/HAK/KT family potassium transporter [Comamonadaceae bacterium]